MRRRFALLLLFVVVLYAARFITGRLLRDAAVPTGSYLLLNLRGTYVEAPPQDLLGKLTGGGKPLLHLLETVRAAADDERIAGVIARIGPLNVGWAKAQDIRDAFTDFRKSNKPLLALLEQEASSGNVEYYVATAAERIYLSPAATAPLNGLASNFVFLGGLWEYLDIELTVEKVREYKTMGDMLANKRMTNAHRQMANSLLDSIDEQFITGLAEGRGLDAVAVRRIIDDCPVAPAAYEAAGLSDGTKYLEAIHESLGGDQVRLLDEDEYAPEVASRRSNGGPQVAIVYATGTIVAGESTTGLQGEMVGADTLREALNEAVEDEHVRAVVLRVDSPGGSALASDLVWRATQTVRQSKPLIVSMSDVAASGGYYISAGADRIFAQPGTFTGSIGVVFARPNVRELLRGFGINTETISRGRFAYLDDITTPIDEEGRSKLIAEMDHIYEQFVDRVAKGRELSPEEVNEIGRGRVWTGAQAANNGLTDGIGGLAVAIDAAKERAGIDPSSPVELVFLPREKPLLARIADVFRSRGVLQVPDPIRTLTRVALHPFSDGTFATLMPALIEIR
jgi:protease-4